MPSHNEKIRRASFQEALIVFQGASLCRKWDARVIARSLSRGPVLCGVWLSSLTSVEVEWGACMRLGSDKLDACWKISLAGKGVSWAQILLNKCCAWAKKKHQYVTSVLCWNQPRRRCASYFFLVLESAKAKRHKWLLSCVRIREGEAVVVRWCSQAFLYTATHSSARDIFFLCRGVFYDLGPELDGTVISWHSVEYVWACVHPQRYWLTLARAGGLSWSDPPVWLADSCIVSLPPSSSLLCSLSLSASQSYWSSHSPFPRWHLFSSGCPAFPRTSDSLCASMCKFKWIFGMHFGRLTWVVSWGRLEQSFAYCFVRLACVTNSVTLREMEHYATAHCFWHIMLRSPRCHEWDFQTIQISVLVFSSDTMRITLDVCYDFLIRYDEDHFRFQ